MVKARFENDDGSTFELDFGNDSDEGPYERTPQEQYDLDRRYFAGQMDLEVVEFLDKHPFPPNIPTPDSLRQAIEERVVAERDLGKFGEDASGRVYEAAQKRLSNTRACEALWIGAWGSAFRNVAEKRPEDAKRFWNLFGSRKEREEGPTTERWEQYVYTEREVRLATYNGIEGPFGDDLHQEDIEAAHRGLDDWVGDGEVGGHVGVHVDTYTGFIL
jgi:hypothetical protein